MQFQPLAKITPLLIAPLAFWNLQAGSLYNSDDSLYAEVAREASQGHWFPLTFSGNVFWNKPPLLFWIQGALLKFLPGSEFTFRLPSALALVALILVTYYAFFKVFSWSVAALGGLLLLGSTLLMNLSQRVLLDVPYVALCVCILFVATIRRTKQLFWIWPLALLGWWIREFAMIPTLIAAGIMLLANRRDAFREKTFWMGLVLFLVGLGALFFLRGDLPGRFVPASAVLVDNALPNPLAKGIYWDVMRSDSLFLWLFPFSIFWISYKWKTFRGRPGFIFALAALLHLTSVMMTQTVLPHYLLPTLVFALIAVAEVIHEIIPWRVVRGIILILAALAAIPANAFRFDSASPELNPSTATKSLSNLATSVLPKNQPLCVLDTYIPGFRFYAERTVLGFYSSEKYFVALNRIPEFRGLIRRTNTDSFLDEVRTTCSGFLVLPSQALRHVSGNPNILASVEALSFVHFSQRVLK